MVGRYPEVDQNPVDLGYTVLLKLFRDVRKRRMDQCNSLREPMETFSRCFQGIPIPVQANHPFDSPLKKRPLVPSSSECAVDDTLVKLGVKCFHNGAKQNRYMTKILF